MKTIELQKLRVAYNYISTNVARNMKDIKLLADEDLIEYVYKTSIQIYKPSEISDWSTWRQWISSTNELSEYGQMAYRISSLHNQIQNGGFIQYFDNRYAIFAYQTLDDLLEIGAQKTWGLLSEALSLVNPDNHTSHRYFDYVYFCEYDNNWEMIAQKLGALDAVYYKFCQPEEPIRLLADYYRKHL